MQKLEEVLPFVHEAKNIHLAFYLYAAKSLGIKYKVLYPGIAQFWYKDKTWFIVKAMTPLNSMTARVVSGNKFTTVEVLRKAGLSVPKQTLVYSFKDLVSAKKQLGDIVVKPIKGSGGHGITILPQTKNDLQKAYKSATQKRKIAIAEEYFEGENYRIIVLGNKVLGVIKRLSAFVIGDGKHTIAELIEQKNKKRKKVGNATIKFNYDLELMLQKQNLSLNDIPAKGQKVALHGTSNLSEGGDVLNAQDSLQKYYLDISVKAAKALNLRFSGVDLIVRNPTQPGPYIINELNHSPGVRLAFLGTGRNIAEDVLKYIINLDLCVT